MNCKRCGGPLRIDRKKSSIYDQNRIHAFCTCLLCGQQHTNILIRRGNFHFYNGSPLPYSLSKPYNVGNDGKEMTE